jgi:hypothetical protein
MDEHFADLFARYEQLTPRHSVPFGAHKYEPAIPALDLPLPRPAVLGS